MKTNQIVLLLGGAAIAYGLYAMNRTPQPPAGFQGANYIPPGSSWNGIMNGTNQPTWVQITGGVLTAVNSLGQVLASMPWDQWTGSGSTTITNNAAAAAGAGLANSF